MHRLIISGRTHEAVNRIASGEGNFKYTFLYRLKIFLLTKSKNDLPKKKQNKKTPKKQKQKNGLIAVTPSCLKLPELL